MRLCCCIRSWLYHWLVASVSLVSLVTLFSVSTALMRASSLKQMFHLNTNCWHTWLIWMGHLSAVEHCNLLELDCTMLCEALLKMELLTSALASLETQAVPAMTCVHEQLIFSTVVPCSLPATYYNVITKESELHHSIGSPIDGAHPGPKTDRDYLGRYFP